MAFRLRGSWEHPEMQWNPSAVRRSFETTFPPVFVGLCLMLVGLGLLDQSLARQVCGFGGAFIVAVMTHRPLAAVNLGRDGDVLPGRGPRT
jgi:hypothetical protein